jgi:putative lipoic acid-binding regulatory protein
MGFASATFQSEVLTIIHRHADPVAPDQITERMSAKGNYISVTIIIEATGEEQLKKLFEDLKEQESVKLVL